LPVQLIQKVFEPISIGAGVRIFPYILQEEEIIRRDGKFFAEFEDEDFELLYDSDEKLLEELAQRVAVTLKPNEVLEIYIFMFKNRSGGFLRKPVPIGERALQEVAGVVSALRDAIEEAKRAEVDERGEKRADLHASE
jgi:hypothetical protein